MCAELVPDERLEKNAMVLPAVWQVLYLTTSKTVPQSTIDDAPGPVKGGPTPICVIVWHGGVGVRVGASHLLEGLWLFVHGERGNMRVYQSVHKCSLPSSLPTCSSGVGENIFASCTSLEKSKG